MNVDSVIKELKLNTPRVVSVVGSGISKASGMPTFRGDDGLWKNYSAQDLATPYAFAENPQLVWDWYRWRMKILLEAEPNSAHEALTLLERNNFGIGVITQNVDGLHEIAGTKNIIEIHGRIRYARCTDCDKIVRWDNEKFANTKGELPYCTSCKESLLRPDVVWFGESLDSAKIDKSMQWIDGCNLVLVIGTSGTVYPVASFPSYAKQKKSAVVIEFNIEPTPLTAISDYSIFGPSEQTLPEFVNKLIKKYGKSENNE